jgi:hypothetical protein
MLFGRDKAFRQVSHLRHQNEFEHKRNSGAGAVEKYEVDTNVVWEL